MSYRSHPGSSRLPGPRVASGERPRPPKMPLMRCAVLVLLVAVLVGCPSPTATSAPAAAPTPEPELVTSLDPLVGVWVRRGTKLFMRVDADGAVRIGESRGAMETNPSVTGTIRLEGNQMIWEDDVCAGTSSYRVEVKEGGDQPTAIRLRREIDSCDQDRDQILDAAWDRGG